MARTRPSGEASSKGFRVLARHALPHTVPSAGRWGAGISRPRAAVTEPPAAGPGAPPGGHGRPAQRTPYGDAGRGTDPGQPAGRTAIGLYASTDNGADWTFLNIIITAGGWSSGLASPAPEDTYHETDPVWEPYVMVYDNQVVAYYSDGNDDTGYNTATGALTIDPDNATAPAAAVPKGFRSCA